MAASFFSRFARMPNYLDLQTWNADADLEFEI